VCVCVCVCASVVCLLFQALCMASCGDPQGVPWLLSCVQQPSLCCLQAIYPRRGRRCAPLLPDRVLRAAARPAGRARAADAAHGGGRVAEHGACPEVSLHARARLEEHALCALWGVCASSAQCLLLVDEL